MSHQDNFKKRKYQSPRYGVFYGVIGYYDRYNGEGTIAFIRSDERGERQELNVGFDITSLRSRGYNLNEGEKVRFKLVKRDNRDVAVEIIPTSLEEILRRDMQEQIKMRLSKLAQKVESERKRKR